VSIIAIIEAAVENCFPTLSDFTIEFFLISNSFFKKKENRREKGIENQTTSRVPRQTKGYRKQKEGCYCFKEQEIQSRRVDGNSSKNKNGKVNRVDNCCEEESWSSETE
jgi:hypothetical protein